MVIVVDTSVIARDFLFRSGISRLLIDGVWSTGHSLYFPQVVIDEATAKYVDSLRECQAQIDKGLRGARRLTDLDVQAPLPDDLVGNLRCRYGRMFREWAEESTITVLPYPSTTHDELVNRDLSGRRPFRPSGKGYRDALIWESILTLAAKTEEEIALLTCDARDFCGDSMELHPDLAADLRERGFACDRVKVYTDATQFVQTHISKVMDQLATVRDMLQQRTYPGFDLEAALEAAMLRGSNVTWCRFTAGQAGLPPQAKEPWVDEVEGICGLDVLDVLRLSSDELMIGGMCDLRCAFHFSLEPPDAESLAGDDSIMVVTKPLGDGMCLSMGSRAVVVNLLMAFDPNNKRLGNVDVIGLQPYEMPGADA